MQPGRGVKRGEKRGKITLKQYSTNKGTRIIESRKGWRRKNPEDIMFKMRGGGTE